MLSFGNHSGTRGMAFVFVCTFCSEFDLLKALTFLLTTGILNYEEITRFSFPSA